jgi:putative flippase GtrA
VSSITGEAPAAAANTAATASEQVPAATGDAVTGDAANEDAAAEPDRAPETAACATAGPAAAPAPAPELEPEPVSSPISPRWIASSPLWMRYAAGSLIATVLSQIALTVAYGVLGATAVVASIAAFFAGTIPNYFLNKAWAWSGHKVSHRRLIVSYLAVIAVTNVAAIVMTVAADSVIRAHVRSDGLRTVLLDLAYLTSNLLMFVVKCVLFDGVLFKPAARPDAEAVEAPAAGVHVS